MEETKSKFKVVDRRRFDQEGNPLESSDQDTSYTASATEPPSEQAKGEQVRKEGASPQNVTGKQSEAEPAEHLGEQKASDADLTFSGLILSLMSQALMHMGEISGVPSVAIDLEAAKNVIDILDILKQKTKGNLTREEAELLNQACGSLKLKYLELVNRFQQKTQKM